MKLFLLTTFVATICCVNAGKKQRMLVAMNGGMMGGTMGGVIPGVMAGGLNPPMVAGGGVGYIAQPQFAQFVPRVPAFAVPGPVPNVYTVPNEFPFMRVPQMTPLNLPQQPLMRNPGGVMQQQQQLPLQPDPLRRFRRQIMKQDNTLSTTVDTQIPPPAETMTTAPCDKS